MQLQSALTLFSGLLENLVFSGISLGWPSLHFLAGYLLDRFGTWIERSFGTFLLTLGCLLLAVSTPATSWLLYPAMISIAISGYTLLISNTQIANLVDVKARGFVITLLAGMFDSGAVVFSVMKLAYEAGYSLKAILHIYIWCTFCTWFRTFALMPKEHIPFPLPKAKLRYGWEEWICFKKSYDKSETDPILDTPTINDDSAATTITQIDTGFSDCLKNLLLWTNAFHICIISFRVNFYFGTFLTLMEISEDPSNISNLTNIFGIMLFCGFIAAPLNGLLVDGVIKHPKARNVPDKISLLRASFASMLTTSSLAITLSVFIVVANSILSFVFQLLTRSFVYGGTTTFLAMHFPQKHFGKLFGLTYFIVGTVTLLQYALFKLATAVDPTFYFINVGLLVVVCLTLVHPLMLFFLQQNK
ncbi:unnamed protein product [Clavelina lepadiformis]|uniref:Uncharacterized protein n=1 Tax=Clavelina lepadiformis TaxID=159417 RepID=A0ABP0GRK6_CLALP